ncbi:kinesin-like protein KIF28P [Caerostris extrusa]|uniref:Kinesin-like protein KIF28P n=1 Tax=Caerostris extrusa TaxID=172846 RepID=A0AAV4VJ05_CAEEX|nr:kinesin-like protein KIF28P [Caerostris extrusa]
MMVLKSSPMDIVPKIRLYQMEQNSVIRDLGRGVLRNAWDGYNSALFAYGQTGSGKSWSVIGYGSNKGIVPKFCEEMFRGIEDKRRSGDTTEFEVRISMLEIYNEIVRDLLNPGGDRKKRALNRAHTIVGIHLTQKARKGNGQETAKSSIVHLVDLAGRDSVLTRLLMNALGGNSRTIMIAAISPADINYEETLSTLRYADRAKQIKTVAIVNEDPTEKLIRELRQENERLKRMLDKGAIDVPIQPGMSEEEIFKLRKKWEEEMYAAMAENDRDLQQMKQSYDDKLKISRQQKRISKIEKEKKVRPHFTNLNFDPMLSGKIVHLLKAGENIVGKTDQADIQLLGPSIQERHAIVNYLEHGGVTLEKCQSECRILLNGDPLSARALLSHCDRIMFGTTQLYVFIHPDQMKKTGKKYPDVTYEMAQEEIASKAGISVDDDDQSLDTALLNKDLIEVLPGVEEANAISEELDKKLNLK